MKKRMSYPLRLIPKSHYKIISEWPSDIDCFYVTRATEKNVKLGKVADLRKNLADHIQASRFLKGLSVNLIAIYKRQDTRIALYFKGDDRYSDYWEIGKNPVCPKKSHIKHQRSGYFGFLVADLLRIKMEGVELKNNGKNNGKYDISFKLYHKPTCSNFWHCEFHIFGKSCEDGKISGTMQELQENEIISKNAVKGIANSMMSDFEKIVRWKGNIKHRRLYYRYYFS